MDNRFTEAPYVIEQARDALRRNGREKAQRFAERVASLMPQSEDPRSILTAVANPQTNINYLQKALEINPNSPCIHKVMQWAMTRLQESPDGVRDNSDDGEQVMIQKEAES